MGGFDMIQRILCATDLTNNSADGVACAFSLAERNAAHLIVFHATSFLSLWQYAGDLDACYPWERWVSRFRVDHVLARAERRVRTFIREKFPAESDRVAWKPKIALGEVAEEMVTAALQEEVDLIVMDRRRRPVLARAFTRGVLERVCRTAPCPVLSMDAAKPNYRSSGWRIPMVQEIVQAY
jgi:nucleotide-binding universal stress UspA family protein